MTTCSIVTYKTDPDELRACLDCMPQGAGVERVYVVDNARQKAIEQVCQEYPLAEYIPSDNLGYGASNNIAIRKAIAAGARYHIVMNSDVSFAHETIAKLQSYMDAREDVVLVQPAVVFPGGWTQCCCRLLPWPAVLIFRRFVPERLFRRMNDRYELKFFAHDREIDAPYLSGCFMFLRTDALRRAGLFDERFFLYPEDIDLSRRLHRIGRTMFYPEAEIVHAWHAESYRSWKLLLIHTRNMIRYFNKWGWVFDSERRRWNRELLRELGYFGFLPDTNN